ncbi:bifunctional glutamate N-acetyltransferase/amino-acid acetyltransferase ArgJ [Sedimentisphaera salicampi]|uniref:bifunctional glutamate N-acetyltransferase/amino-acid acetyltransferase ArgJ n=1 Tax=Sedimentisphaera salicampi TaxID=1941349 RepID=UPI000B9D3140|nr:bifunctional glutamate N-acetyltransferase/amino-acid acetyltransferase ArgJ [Sedimentisphaera salicampi]OXU15296.1 Arginine biosynthesis bifunctional protein ArgJ [Sedimentisphaera salicampi]
MKKQGLTAPAGFLASGVQAGIKDLGSKDLGMISCPQGAKAAGVFTTNAVVSAAVEVCRENLACAKCFGVVVNSGVANACTGKKGLSDARSMCREAGKALKADQGAMLVASTGVIGRKLPMDKVRSGIRACADLLSDSQEAARDFAEAILTTDTVSKQHTETVRISGKEVTIAGAIKGAGMIAPNMATTLCFLTADAAISKRLLQKALREAAGESLNKLTVDGHQSTNDTALLLSSGKAGNAPISRAKSPDYKKFYETLLSVCRNLTRQMALDAEGATKIFKVEVSGAVSKKDARKAARAVADYDLVKCAINGSDPNWGRIICAIGSCGAKVNVDNITCRLGRLTVFRSGRPVKFDKKRAEEIVSQKEHTILIDLGAGSGSDFCWGCDLSKKYVEINADYHT